jgi:hypothetical protein
MKSNPSTRCLLFGAPTPCFRAVRNKNREEQRSRSETQRQSRGTRADQRRNIRAEEPGPIRDATSEQRNQSRSETQRQNRGTRAHQRRKVRSDKPRIRAAIKKPAIRRSNKTKKQHGSEDAVSLVHVTL